MKLKYIVNLRIPTEKAHGYQICKMCEEFSLAGLGVELIVPKRENFSGKDIYSYYDLKNNFKITYIDCYNYFKLEKYLGKFTYFFSSYSFLLKLLFIRFDKETIIYSRNPEICWLFNLRGYRTIFDAHNWPISKSALFKFFISKVSGIICNSRGTEEVFRKNGFTKIFIAPNGVDLKKYEIDEDVTEVRNVLELPQDKKIVLYVGHLYEWKGIDVFLGTAKLMSDREDIVFAVVGGTDRDLVKYRQKVENYNINNVLMIGHKPQKMVPLYLKSSDVLVLPNVPVSVESIKYTSPIKMFEYMASKRPILASDLPSIREILNENNSVLFEAGNEKDLVNKIELILIDKELSKKISQQAFEDVKKYSWDQRARNIINFIKNNR